MEELSVIPNMATVVCKGSEANGIKMFLMKSYLLWL